MQTFQSRYSLRPVFQKEFASTVIWYGTQPPSSPAPLAPYRTPKSQEVLRQMGFETAFSARAANPQSEARSAKPRMVRGSRPCESLFSDFEI